MVISPKFSFLSCFFMAGKELNLPLRTLGVSVRDLQYSEGNWRSMTRSPNSILANTLVLF